MLPDTNPHEPITVTITPTRSDLVNFNMRFTLGRPGALLYYGSIWIAAILWCLYGVPMCAQGRPVNPNAPRLAAISVSVAMFVGITLGKYIAVVRRWNAAPELREQRQYTFTGEGIQVTAASFAVFIAWSHIGRAGRLAGQVYLVTNQNLFHIIPVATFGDDYERFRTLVAERVRYCRL